MISFRADPASRSEVSLFLNRFQNTFQNMFQNRFQNTRLALSGGGRKRSGEEAGCDPQNYCRYTPALTLSYTKDGL